MMVDSRATTGFPDVTALRTCSLTRTSELICRFVCRILETRRVVGRIIEDQFCKFPLKA